jgi:hypothetical protein
MAGVEGTMCVVGLAQLPTLMVRGVVVLARVETPSGFQEMAGRKRTHGLRGEHSARSAGLGKV